MNTNTHLTPEQALRCALAVAGIENEEPRCLSARFEGGLYHFAVCTSWLRYEFYVDAVSGGVPGIGTEPLSYREALALCGEAPLSAVA